MYTIHMIIKYNLNQLVFFCIMMYSFWYYTSLEIQKANRWLPEIGVQSSILWDFP